MKKVIQTGGYIIAGLAALIVLIIIILKLISDNQYKQWITEAVQSSTGRDFTIESLELDFSTTVKATASQIKLANASWGDQPQMLSLEKMQAEIDLFKLFAGTAELRGIVDGLNLFSQTTAEGINNWTILKADNSEQPDDQQQKSESKPELIVDFIIREFRINNAVINIIAADEKKNVNALIEEFVIETPETDASFNLKANVNSTAVQVNGDIGQLSGLVYSQSSPVSVDALIGENTLSVNGEWGPFLPDPALSLKTGLNIIAPTPLAGLIGIDIIDIGEMKLSAQLDAKDGKFSISEIVSDLDGAISGFKVAGSIGDLLNLRNLEIETTASTVELGSLLEKFQIELPFELPPKVDIDAKFHGGLDNLGARDITVEVIDEGLDVSFTGEIENAIGVKGIDGYIVASVDSLALLSKYAGFNLPDLGSLKITANVKSNDNKLSLTDIEATLVSENIQIGLTGDIGDLMTTQGIRAQLTADIKSLTPQNISEIQTLLNHFQLNFPLELLPESAAVITQLEGDLSRLSISNIEAEIHDQDIAVSLNGQMDDVLTTSGLASRFTLKSGSLSSLSKYAGMELPTTKTLDVSGKINSSNDTFSLNDFKATLLADGFDVKLDANIDDLLKTSGINAELHSQIDSLSALSSISQARLPQTDPITIDATLKSHHTDNSDPAAVSILASSNKTRLKLDGNLKNLMSVENILAAVEIEAASLDDLNQFTGTELPDMGPLLLKGNISVEGREYELQDFELKLDQQAINGSVSASLPETDNEITLLSGELDVTYFDLSPFITNLSDAAPQSGQESATKDTKETSEKVTTTDSDRLFSTDPLALEALRAFNTELSIKADKIKAIEAEITDVVIALTIKDGLLSVEPIKALSDGGNLNGKIIFDGQNDNAILDMDLVVENFPLVQLEGTYNLNLNLQGDGPSLAELMGGLDGQAIVAINDAKIKKSFATKFGSGLFSFSEDKDHARIECGILRMDIEDGIADFDDKLAIQLTEVTWHGGGHINFKNEEIGLAIVPEARKGIDIGVGNLTSLFYVDGMLKNPKVQLNPTDMAVKYGKYMAYVSTGGLSLVAETLYKKMFANKDLCESILDGTVFDKDPE